MSEETIYEAASRRNREAVANYFRRLADAFDGGDAVAVGDSVALEPPEEGEFEVEVEREDDDVSLEVEVAWDEAAVDVDADADVDPAVTVDPEATVDPESTSSDATFELYRDSADEWRWRLRHANGNVVADGGEGYTKKANAVNGIDSVRRNAPGADLDVQD